MVKSIEQKLFEAFQRGTGAHLTPSEVFALVRLDDAMGARITNAASTEAGLDEPGGDAVGPPCRISWSEFKARLIRENGPIAEKAGGGG